MDEVGFASVPEDALPNSPAALAALLGGHFEGPCTVEDDDVTVEVDGARFVLTLVPGGEDGGIDIAGDEGEGDLVAGFMILSETLEAALPGAEVSSAWA